MDIEAIPGFWRIHWQIGKITLISTFYTKIDQACILWGLISAVIFITAQFVPIDWQTQAIWWSILTVIGTAGMVKLTWFWAKFEGLLWVLYTWVILMLAGLVLTDLSVFLGWGEVLMRLSELWLGLSAVGYLYTGLAMRSRMFTITGIIHLVSIFLLPYFPGWQFLTTGIVMGGSVLLLAELQWDSVNTCDANQVDYNLLKSQPHQYSQEHHALQQIVNHS